jgi:predicted secreted protein
MPEDGTKDLTEGILKPHTTRGAAMQRSRSRRLSAAVAAIALGASLAIAAPAASAKPVDNTVTLTILPAQLRLDPGESATIRLSTNLTTGYRWTFRVAGNRSSVSVVQNDPAALPSGSLIGAPTTTDWIVTATKTPGTAVVKIIATPPGRTKGSVVGSLRVIVQR